MNLSNQIPVPLKISLHAQVRAKRVAKTALAFHSAYLSGRGSRGRGADSFGACLLDLANGWGGTRNNRNSIKGQHF